MLCEVCGMIRGVCCCCKSICVCCRYAVADAVAVVVADADDVAVASRITGRGSMRDVTQCGSPVAGVRDMAVAKLFWTLRPVLPLPPVLHTPCTQYSCTTRFTGPIYESGH